MTETVSPHRIQHGVQSAQFRIHPAEVAGRLGGVGRNLPSIDFELVHRLGTTNIVWSVKDLKTGKLVLFNSSSPATILDSMRLLLNVPAPFPEAYDVTVIG